jgi:sulfatase maturation enzyme AslB (radical SAM superfamily)
VPLPALPTRLEIEAGDRTFASGLLLDLVSAIRRVSPGDLFGITAADGSIDADLNAWSQLTGHAIVSRISKDGCTRWVVRHGAVPAHDLDARPLGERLWLYVNFDCNLQCDYCCVRSSPAAPRRALGLAAVRRIADEAPPLGVRQFFVTGGEPLLLPDIDELALALASAAPVTLLTNGMLFRGPRLSALKRLPRDRVTLQVSLDSPTPELHDRHRGRGAWQRAIDGIAIARAEGFRVRLAATVANDADERGFCAFLDRLAIPAEDRVIRRVALRGSATTGIALGRSDLVPEITITTDGVYWHPVGAEDDDLLITRDLFPLAQAFEAVRRSVADQRAHQDRVASVFHCA